MSRGPVTCRRESQDTQPIPFSSHHPYIPSFPFSGDVVGRSNHHPSGPPPPPIDQATAPRSVVPPPPPLRAATAPTCYHNSHGHPRGSTTPLTTYHWLWPLSTPQVGIYLCPWGGKHTTTSQGLVWFRAMHVVGGTRHHLSPPFSPTPAQYFCPLSPPSRRSFYTF